MIKRSLFSLGLYCFMVGALGSCQAQYSIKETVIRCIQGDIVKQNVDCVVNAANDQLQGGAGVCGAIFEAAGWQALQDSCNQYPLVNGVRCATGTACITPSYALKENGPLFIIHAIGPDCRKITDEKQQDILLVGAYKSSLCLATEKGAKSIAFPFISSAIFAFPKKRAAYLALKTVKEFLETQKTSLTEIRFVLFNETDLNLFKDMLN